MTEPAYVSLRFKFMRFESIDENSDFMPSMIKIKNLQFLEPFFIIWPPRKAKNAF